MEPAPAVLKQKGFSLIELLVAVSLVAVVMSLAFMVLESTRRVAEEIESSPGSSADGFWAQLQMELDSLLLLPVQTDTPPLRYSDEDGLELVTLLKNPEGIPLETLVHYYVEDDQLFKISASGYPLVAQTNKVANAISGLRTRGLIEDKVFEKWPNENEDPLTPRLRIEVETSDRRNLEREFYLPASFRIKPPALLEESDPIQP